MSHPLAVQGRDLRPSDSWNAMEILEWAVDTFGDKVALASSFGAEDVALIDMLASIQSKPRVFTLDTGRLHPETYQLMGDIEKRYRIHIEVYFPVTAKVEEMVRAQGINLFYESVEKRKQCCQVRKLEPLQRALSGLSAWITGLRRGQSAFRSRVEKVEVEENGRVKINPLADWTESALWEYIQDREVPFNALHNRNYPSIGCAPCTRAVAAGEDPRAGRWWWENTHKECGLHVRNRREAIERGGQT